MSIGQWIQDISRIFWMPVTQLYKGSSTKEMRHWRKFKKLRRIPRVSLPRWIHPVDQVDQCLSMFQMLPNHITAILKMYAKSIRIEVQLNTMMWGDLWVNKAKIIIIISHLIWHSKQSWKIRGKSKDINDTVYPKMRLAHPNPILKPILGILMLRRKLMYLNRNVSS